MSVISKSVKIKAPPDKVFAFVTNPENWTHFVTSLVDISDLSPDAPAKGSTFRWKYNMMGLKFKGDGTVTEYSKNKTFGFAFKSKVPISEHYDFVDMGDGVTELKVRVEFEMPIKALDIFASNKIVEKLNNAEAKNILDKIKILCET
jgi:uncharacterized membrane protein